MKTGFVVRHEPATNESKDNSEDYCGNPNCDKYIEDSDWEFCPFCGCKFLSKEEEQIIIVERQAKYAVFSDNELRYDSIETEKQAYEIYKRVQQKYPHAIIKVKLLTECERERYL